MQQMATDQRIRTGQLIQAGRQLLHPDRLQVAEAALQQGRQVEAPVFELALGNHLVATGRIEHQTPGQVAHVGQQGFAPQVHALGREHQPLVRLAGTRAQDRAQPRQGLFQCMVGRGLNALVERLHHGIVGRRIGLEKLCIPPLQRHFVRPQAQAEVRRIVVEFTRLIAMAQVAHEQIGEGIPLGIGKGWVKREEAHHGFLWVGRCRVYQCTRSTG
ncbi:hypothetical protein D3C76_1189110 [compost metagenome]